MRIDDQTLRDLEIFEAQRGAPGVFDLLDRTRTRGGRECLRARFLRPLSCPTRIRAVQDSLRFICRERAHFAPLPNEAELSALDRYLRSNIVLITAATRVGVVAQSLWARLVYPDLYASAAAGVQLAVGFADSLSRFIASPSIASAPGELGEIVQDLRSTLGVNDFVRAASSRTPGLAWSRVLRADRYLREEGREKLERLMRLVHELDALVSMADGMAERGYVLPEVELGPARIQAEGVYHPFLPLAVPNDCEAGEAGRFLFITGPNMAGKTTYLRACGVALYLAHLGMGVPARRLRFTPFDALFSAVSLSDNIREGVSFFRAEALRVKQVALSLAGGARVLALLDEPFKGTNVKDALDASSAVFVRFAATPDSVFLVSSHLIELAEVLQPLPSVVSQRFEAREIGGKWEYDYVLRPGISAQRLGMCVLQQEGVLDLLASVPAAAKT